MSEQTKTHKNLDKKFIGLLEALRTDGNTAQIDIIKQGFSVVCESLDDITDAESLDELEGEYYDVNGDDEWERDQVTARANNTRLKPEIDKLVSMIKNYGYHSPEVREFNDTIGGDDRDIINNKARAIAKYGE